MSKIIRNGIDYGGKHYVLSERSASMCRQAELGFVDESISEQLDEIVSMGLNLQSTVLSKWFAYRGLMLSSCFCLENWLPQIIVVDDFTVTIPNQHIRYLAEAEPYEYIDNHTGEKKTWHGKKITDGHKNITIMPWDGAGLIHPELANEIKELIGIEDEDPTSIMIRAPLIKGVVHAIQYDDFWYEHGVREITDIYGHKWNAQGKYIILTKSQFKGFKYFKNFDEYLDKFEKYNHCFGIAKWNYSVENEPRYTRTSYQILQTLDLPYDEFEKIADYSKDLIEKIISGDKFYTYAFLGLFADNLKPQNDYMKAILKNPEMLKDHQIHKYLTGIVQKYINEMKCGKVWIKGAFKIVVSDLIMLMQRIAGIEANGVLDEDEFWSKSYEGVCRGHYTLNRNPHISESESVCLRGTGYNKWYWQLDNVVMVNAKSITLARMSGEDCDGDLCLLSNNEQLLTGINEKCLPILDIEDKISAKEREITLENVVDSIVFSFDVRIGEYSNMATSYLNKTPRTEEQKQRYKDNIDYISVLNGKEIDKVKTNIQYQCPRYISKYAKPYPQFMKYAGAYYSRMKNFNYAHSNMNRLCRDIIKWERKIKQRKPPFKWSLLIDKNIPKNQEKFDKIYELYLKFKDIMTIFHKYQYILSHRIKPNKRFEIITQDEINNRQINWEFYYNQYRKEANLICGDQKELANYAVEICYKLHPMNVKMFAWVVAKEGILNNLTNSTVDLPYENHSGSYTFLGRNYAIKKNIAVY